MLLPSERTSDRGRTAIGPLFYSQPFIRIAPPHQFFDLVCSNSGPQVRFLPSWLLVQLSACNLFPWGCAPHQSLRSMLLQRPIHGGVLLIRRRWKLVVVSGEPSTLVSDNSVAWRVRMWSQEVCLRCLEWRHAGSWGLLRRINLTCWEVKFRTRHTAPF